jgi:ribosomal protein S18 acetylase RimI-like enzyme
MKDLDIKVVAELTFEALQKSALHSEERSLNKLKEQLGGIRTSWENAALVTANDESTDRLLGWMTIQVKQPETGIIFQWHPIVHPDKDSDEIARALIEHSKTLVETHSRSRLEIWLELQNESHKEHFKSFIPWYDSCGFKRAGMEHYLDIKISSLELEETSIPSEFEIISLADVTNEDLLSPVYDTFITGSDRWFLGQTKRQQEMVIQHLWFDRSYSHDMQASFVLRKDGEIIGFMAAIVEEGVAELGPIGVVPEYRGDGLGESIMRYSLKQLKSNDIDDAWLTVSHSSEVAYRLYEKLGFTKRYDIDLYSWTP